MGGIAGIVGASQTDTALEALDRAVDHHAAGRWRDACLGYIDAIQKDEAVAKLEGRPVNPMILHAAGVALAQGGKPAVAVEFLEAAIKQEPTNGAAWSALGLAYTHLRNYGRAERALHFACRFQPQSVNNWVGYANLAHAGGAHTVGLDRSGIARQLEPRDSEERLAHAMLDLQRGHWRKGWKGYESRTATALWGVQNQHATRFGPNRYHFANVPTRGARVVVVCEQGQGDAVMGARFIQPFAQRYGVEVVAVVAHNALVEMLAGALPYPVVGKDGAVAGDVDGWVLLLSLPALVGCDARPWVPAPIRPFGRRWEASQAVPGRLFVHGQGNAGHTYDYDRSAPAGVLEAAGEDAGFTIVRAGFAAGDGQYTVAVEPTWQETVDVLLTCERCLTVDTGLAHVAASLGVPTDILLPTIPEWRWPSDGDRTPWYPSATLWRRSRTEAWVPMLESWVDRRRIVAGTTNQEGQRGDV